MKITLDSKENEFWGDGPFSYAGAYFDSEQYPFEQLKSIRWIVDVYNGNQLINHIDQTLSPSDYDNADEDGFYVNTYGDNWVYIDAYNIMVYGPGSRAVFNAELEIQDKQGKMILVHRKGVRS